MSERLRVAFVVQRYGREVVGGAEAHARELAERTVRELGHHVDVFTTTASDYRTWAPHYPAGEERLGGVGVFPFDTAPRAAWFRLYNRSVRGFLAANDAPAALTAPLERLWYRWQGPYSPALLSALSARASAYDRLVFFTYLYHPTAAGLPAHAEKALLVPTAHDEPALGFPATRRLMAAARLVLANSEAESRLIAARFPEAQAKLRLVGAGIDVPAARPRRPAGPPRLLYLGRLSRGKGVDRLWSLVAAARRTPELRDLELVLAGAREADLSLPTEAHVRFEGTVSDERKKELLEEATAVVNPSAHESLSLVALEALACGRPTILNGDCAVFRDYAKALPTALVFRDESSFIDAARGAVMRDWNTAEAVRELDMARSWVEERYAWSAVLKRFDAALRA